MKTGEEVLEFVRERLRQVEQLRLRAETNPCIGIDFADGASAGLASVLEFLAPGEVDERAKCRAEALRRELQ